MLLRRRLQGGLCKLLLRRRPRGKRHELLLRLRLRKGRHELLLRLCLREGGQRANSRGCRSGGRDRPRPTRWHRLARAIGYGVAESPWLKRSAGAGGGLVGYKSCADTFEKPPDGIPIDGRAEVWCPLYYIGGTVEKLFPHHRGAT